jgi:hypothetical protein
VNPIEKKIWKPVSKNPEQLKKIALMMVHIRHLELPSETHIINPR